MKVEIKCKGAGAKPLDELLDFQWNLKELSVQNYGKLKSLIVKHGFIDPVNIWETDQKSYILSGHQRVHTLKKMREQGFEVPDIPVNYIDCPDEKTAKEFVLAYVAQFGEMTEEGLYEFINKAGITKEELAKYRFQDINLNNFIRNYYEAEDTAPEEEFTIELMEESNYVVIVFNEVLDWHSASQLLELKTVKSLDAVDSKYPRKGVGRVLDGKWFLEKFNK